MLFSPDTNVLYHRFLTNSGMDLRNVLLVDTIPDQISSLKQEVRYQPFLLDEFANRGTKRFRTAAIALAEYGAQSKLTSAHINQCKGSSTTFPWFSEL